MNGNISAPSAYLALIDRPSLQRAIFDILAYKGDEPRVVVIMGKGGAGKTKLLEQSLAALRMREDVIAPATVLDFYHLSNHTRDGFIGRSNALFSARGKPLSTYQREKELLNRLQLAGDLEQVRSQRERAYQAFLYDLQTMSESKRVVIACDTAEKLLYGLDPELRAAHPEAGAWSQVLTDLVRLPRVFLLIAGRPEMSPLLEGWRETLPRGVLHEVTVGPFSMEESKRYYHALSSIADARGNFEASARLRSLSDADIQRVHQFSGGRPIYFTLMLDQVAMGERPEAFNPEGEIPANPAEGVEAFERSFIMRLKEEGLAWGDLVVALGRLTKGGTPELIAELMGVSLAEAERRLEDVKNYSFIKTRPDDGHIFLHDELYALLQRRLFDRTSVAHTTTRIIDIIDAYYDERLEEVRRALDDLYAPVEAEGRSGLDLEALSRVYGERRTLLAEALHYQFQASPGKGYRRYYRYMREAILSGDADLDRQLQVELESCLTSLNITLRDDVRQAIRSIILIRPTVRAWAEGDYTGVIALAAELREQHPDLFNDETRPSCAILDVWEAYALIIRSDRGDLSDATQLLDRAIERLTSRSIATYLLTEEEVYDDKFMEWRRQAVLALAYRVRGYLRWTLSDMAGSEQDLQEALLLWRPLKVRVEWATTLKDLGFSQAEQNKTKTAVRHVRHALEEHKALGARGPVALNYNSLGRIRLIEGNFESAIQQSSIALALGRALEDRRVTGLALINLAESYRYYAISDRTRGTTHKLSRLLHAWRIAEEAAELFEQTGETLRRIEAGIEEGCALRDMIRVLNNSGQPVRHLAQMLYHASAKEVPAENHDSLQRLLGHNGEIDVSQWLERLVERSHDALEEAEALAQESYPHLRLEAAVNKVWLYYYASAPSQSLTDMIVDVWGIIPEEYLITAYGSPQIERGRAQGGIWKQVGKLYLLEGMLALEYMQEEAMLNANVTPSLQVVADRFAWALEYATLYGEDHRDLRQDEEMIYEQLIVLSKPQLSAISRVVHNIAARHRLGQLAIERFMRESGIWYR